VKTNSTQLSLFETRGPSDSFAVRVSARARRLTARVHVGGRVEIVVPEGVTPKSVRDFVQRFTPWIDRKVAAMQCVVPAADPVPRSVDFLATGERFAVDWRVGPRRLLREQAGCVVALEAPDDREARALLRRWLKTAAAARLVPGLEELSRAFSLPVARVSIRCQRTRWGSCSTRGTVSLNCSLLFQRAEVVRYLYVHELAHLKCMNHSPKFWALVEKLEPDYQRLDRELLAGWRTVPEWVFRI
jgi:predicted metal-dependent hydrolase